eukprot:GHVS01079585.1.p1 GENE.GHVS01079585.1~~GHVS01079585.1.p1  ORF type:complete len:300 (-),score=48.68 GHVS01079585.1:16-915(-)
MWIAEQAADASIPEGWQEVVDQSGETVYYNSHQQKLQRVHPLVERFARLYHKHKAFYQHTQELQAIPNATDESEANLKNLISKIRRRVEHLQLPPCTPQILEKLAALCRVDTNREFYLVRSLKVTLEGYIKNRLSLETLVRDVASPLSILRGIEEQQTRFPFPRMPTTLLLCTECEARAAVCRCVECKDLFCRGCFSRLHSNGRRREHTPARIEQLACSGCDRMLPSSQCLQCGLFFCSPCFEKAHSTRAELLHHTKQMITGLVCLECEQLTATVVCEPCADLLCTGCFGKLHKKGQRR